MERDGGGSHSSSDCERPQRADARRNHDALVAAATTAFTTVGVETPLEDIARSAGVGIGTLYRHFPSRTSLIEAVYRHEVDAVADAAVDLAGRLGPLDALSAWMERLVSYVAAKRGMAVALRSMTESSPDLFASTRARMVDAVALLLDNASRAGVIRSDVTADDVLRAVSGCCMVSDQPDWRDQAGRMLGLVLDGLRYGAPVGAPTST